MVKPAVIPTKDEKDPDYGNSLNRLQGQYIWDKAAADLAASLARATMLQLNRR